jgi:amidohydrolase
MPRPPQPPTSDLAALKARAAARIDEERAALVELSARIHAHPELCFEEERAAGWLCDYLESRGLTVERGAYGLKTAFAARAGSGEPRIAVLCEYDALPGIGHGCGHNVIAAAGAGAGAALAAVIAETGGSVVVLGTPAEEGGGGKVLMGREGAFAELAAAMMIHPASLELIEMHVLAISAMHVEYSGRAAHASASPHAGRNALDGLVTAYQTIAQLRQHIRPTERIHGIITDGGQKPNIVPERAAGLFYVRAANERRLARLKERVHQCFQAGALASGTELQIRADGVDYSDMWTNAALASAYEANLGALGRRVEHAPPETVSGSTDMGNVSKLVPSIHPMVAIAPQRVALHTAEFATFAAAESGQQGVVDGAKALALTAIDVLCTPDLRTAMRASFDAAQQA